MLALAGGVAGLLLAAASTRLLFYVFKLDALHLPLRPVDSMPMDGRVFVFALLISCVTGLVFGVAPPWSALRGDVNEPSKKVGGAADRAAEIVCLPRCGASSAGWQPAAGC
jgi:hypothetical protein